jgi:hypothetical protein
MTMITSSMQTGELDQALPLAWSGGSGTVTVNDAYWADEALTKKIDPGGGLSQNGAFLVLDVTYKAESGSIPLTRLPWSALSGSYNGALPGFSNTESIPEEGRLSAGETRSGLLTFDIPRGRTEVYLDDWRVPGVQNRLAMWIIDPDSAQRSSTTTT